MSDLMRRILVCGSRTWTDEKTMRVAIIGLGGDRLIIHGGARGADHLAGKIAAEMGFEVEVYLADWKKHGRAAGPIRNQRMIEEGKPREAMTFWDGKSRGTRDMIGRVRGAGIPLRIFLPEDISGDQLLDAFIHMRGGTHV